MAVFTRARADGVSHDRSCADPGAVPGRAGRRHRLGQVDVRAHGTSGRPRCSPATSAAGWSPTTRTTSPRPADAFDVLHYIAGKRLAAGRLTVVDATNVQPEAAQAAGRAGPGARRAAGRDRARPARAGLRRAQRRPAGPGLRRAGDPPPARPAAPRPARRWQREGFRKVHVLRVGRGDRRRATVVRTRLYNDLRDETGPFDVIGDVHGCRAELETLLDRARLRAQPRRARPAGRRAPPGRAARRCSSATWSTAARTRPGVLRLVMGMVAAGDALCVPGNHENKLLRALRGRNVQVTPRPGRDAGPARRARPTSSGREVAAFCDGLVSHYVLDGGRLVVAHAGLKERYHGRASGRVRAFACTATRPGRPTSSACRCATRGREDYRGRAMVLYGHTPDARAGVGQQHDLPGHRLRVRRPADRAALPGARAGQRAGRARSTTSRRGRSRPSADAAAPARRPREPDVLDLADVIGTPGDRDPATRPGRRARGERRRRAGGDEPVRGRPALAAVPAADDGPVATSTRPRSCSSTRPRRSRPTAPTASREVVCEEKHMGSRAVALVCRDARRGAGAVRRAGRRARRGLDPHRAGRSSRPALTAQLLDRVRAAVEPAGLFDELDTAWLLLDAELLPWSAKAEELLRDQYAAVGAAARAALPAAVGGAGARPRPRASTSATCSTGTAARRGQRRRVRRRPTGGTAGRPTGCDGVRLAPFQLLAAEGAAYHDRPHAWHLAWPTGWSRPTRELCAPTRRLLVDTTDPASIDGGDRVVGGADRRRRRGHGGQARRQPRAAAERGLVQPGLKVPRAGSTCGSSTARTTPSRRNLERLRAARPRPQAVAGAARVRPRAGGAGPAGRAASRCGGCTSASSPCWPASRSRWTRGCRKGHEQVSTE